MSSEEKDDKSILKTAADAHILLIKNFREIAVFNENKETEVTGFKEHVNICQSLLSECVLSHVWSNNVIEEDAIRFYIGLLAGFEEDINLHIPAVETNNDDRSGSPDAPALRTDGKSSLRDCLKQHIPQLLLRCDAIQSMIIKASNMPIKTEREDVLSEERSTAVNKNDRQKSLESVEFSRRATESKNSIRGSLVTAVKQEDNGSVDKPQQIQKPIESSLARRRSRSRTRPNRPNRSRDRTRSGGKSSVIHRRHLSEVRTRLRRRSPRKASVVHETNKDVIRVTDTRGKFTVSQLIRKREETSKTSRPYADNEKLRGTDDYNYQRPDKNPWWEKSSSRDNKIMTDKLIMPHEPWSSRKESEIPMREGQWPEFNQRSDDWKYDDSTSSASAALSSRNHGMSDLQNVGRDDHHVIARHGKNEMRNFYDPEWNPYSKEIFTDNNKNRRASAHSQPRSGHPRNYESDHYYQMNNQCERKENGDWTLVVKKENYDDRRNDAHYHLMRDDDVEIRDYHGSQQQHLYDIQTRHENDNYYRSDNPHLRQEDEKYHEHHHYPHQTDHRDYRGNYGFDGQICFFALQNHGTNKSPIGHDKTG
jgi:hypothetical protein